MYIIMIIAVIDQNPLLRLYHTESFTKFIGDVLGLPKLYRLADPLVINMRIIIFTQAILCHVLRLKNGI